MITCPNINSPSFKSLNDKLSEISYYVWNKLKGEIDKEGHPINNSELFTKILEKNGGNYKESYIQFIGEQYKPLHEIIEENKQIEKETLLKGMQSASEVEEEGTPELTHSEQTIIEHLSKLDKMGEIREKAIKANQIKLQALIQRGVRLSDEDIKRVDEFNKKLSELESEQALIEFTKEAHKVVNRYFKEYNNILKQLDDIKNGKSSRKRSDILTPQLLGKWRDYLSAYNVVDEFRDQLFAEGKLYKQPEIRDLINDVIDKKNGIRKLYESEGIDIDAEFLSKYYDRLLNENKLLAKKKYKDLTDDEKSKISEQDFIRAQSEFNKQDIHEQTVLLLKQELQKASRDISTIGRWVDTVADANDPAIFAVYKAMSIATYRTTATFLKTRDELVDHLRELEDFQGSPSNKKLLYDFMLEKDHDGNYTANVVNKFGGSFWKTYDDFKKSLNEEDITSEEYGSKIRKWLNSNTIFKQEAFNNAKWLFINQLKTKGLITDEEMNEINWNDNSRIHMTEHQMAEEGMINDEAANEISHWKSTNIWNFREPTQEWKDKNPQWKKLNDILSNENDPRTKYYNYFIDQLEEHNSKLPYHQRLSNFQIPSVLKTTQEQFADKESIGSIVKTILQKKLNVLKNDTDRTEQYITDEEGNIRHFIPVYYTGALKKYEVKDKSGKFIKTFRSQSSADSFINNKKNKSKGYEIEERNTPEDQSYDLSTVLLRFSRMATDYFNKAEIFPQMELTKFFINNRDVANTDSKGNIIKNLTSKFSKDKGTVKPKNKTNLAAFFNDWYEMAMYGIKEKNQGTIFGIDVAKSANALSHFTSLNLLALNVRAGINNVIVGDAFQLAEAFAKEHMTLKSFNKGHIVFTKNIPGMIADVGSRKPINFINQIYEYFNLPTESLNSNLKDATKFRMLGKRSSLYFIMHAGDFYMQSRLFLGMLENIRTYDKSGKDIGSMLDMYQEHFKEHKEIGLPSKVDITKSNWSQKEIDNFTIKTRGIMSGIHGEYGELERNALQRVALGRMATMFKKFIVPGVRKRYKKFGYSERMGDYTEGYYRSAAKFMINLSKELGTLQFSLAAGEWGKLTPHEKANVIKTFSEVSFAIASVILASFFLGKAKSGDDDDKFYASWMAYQLLRFKTEMLFFTPKIDEAMSILRSPMASMSQFENVTNTVKQLGIDLSRMATGSGPQEYQKGPMKGHYKGEKILFDWIPAARSIYQLISTKQQLNTMNQSLVGFGAFMNTSNK